MSGMHIDCSGRIAQLWWRTWLTGTELATGNGFADIFMLCVEGVINGTTVCTPLWLVVDKVLKSDCDFRKVINFNCKLDRGPRSLLLRSHQRHYFVYWVLIIFCIRSVIVEHSQRKLFIYFYVVVFLGVGLSNRHVCRFSIVNNYPSWQICGWWY